jgi:hypothetical protein
MNLKFFAQAFFVSQGIAGEPESHAAQRTRGDQERIVRLGLKQQLNLFHGPKVSHRRVTRSINLLTGPAAVNDLKIHPQIKSGPHLESRA